MSAPTIAFAYLNYARDKVYVVTSIDHAYAPLKVLPAGQAQDGWTLKRNGVTETVTAAAADPRRNIVTLAFDDAMLLTDTVTLSYDAGPGDIADQADQELVTILPANAITVHGALPIIDLIARDITMRLRDITTANGFLVNLDVEDDLKNTDEPMAEGLARVTYEDPVSEDDAPINHEQFTANFGIEVTTAVSQALTTPLTSKEYQIEAEVMKYLQVDYGRNQLAVDTVPLAPTRIENGEGGWGGVSVNVMVRFRTLYGDRFAQ